jgi:Uncharacterized ABC-type transport system, permease component
MNISIASILALTVTNATPIVLAGTGGIFAERSGIVNIGVEGMMLSGAFAAAVGSFIFSSPWIGLIFGITAALIMAIFHAYLCIYVKINPVISGLAINILASSLTVYLMNIIFGSQGSTPSVMQLPSIQVGILKNVPVIGDTFNNISIITVIAVIVVIVTSFLLNKTSFGLHVVASGQNPAAANSVGIHVINVQFISMVISGITCGLAGAFLSISFMNVFVKDMTAGRGFIAIAMIIFGRYKPVSVALAGLLFGLLDAIQMSLQGVINIPNEIIQSLPYIITIVAVASVAKRNKELSLGE